MKAACLGVLLAVALPASAIGQEKFEARLLHMEHRHGDLPRQWLEVRNSSNAPLAGFNVRCTFFSGSRPISEGGTVEYGPVPPGRTMTFSVGTTTPGVATRAECWVSESTWLNR